MTEGVVKYRCDYRRGAAPDATAVHELQAWHGICRRLGLIGRDPGRYDGCAYGNLSRRLGHDRFLISGTQTGGKAGLTPDDFAWVEACDIAANRVRASGPAAPSSEALTHAALYRASSAARCVIHVHSPEIWHAAAALGLPCTDPQAAYGTPAMAQAVRELFDAGALARDQGLFAMLGHEDGIVSYGLDADMAGSLLIAALGRARRLDSA